MFLILRLFSRVIFYLCLIILPVKNINGSGVKADLSGVLTKYNDYYLLTVKVSPPPNYYIYALEQDIAVGPVKTHISSDSGIWQFDGKSTETNPKKIWDGFFNSFLLVHKKTFEISQKLTKRTGIFNIIKGVSTVDDFFLNYQMCSNNICSLPIKQKINLVK